MTLNDSLFLCRHVRHQDRAESLGEVTGVWITKILPLKECINSSKVPSNLLHPPPFHTILHTFCITFVSNLSKTTNQMTTPDPTKKNSGSLSALSVWAELSCVVIPKRNGTIGGGWSLRLSSSIGWSYFISPTMILTHLSDSDTKRTVSTTSIWPVSWTWLISIPWDDGSCRVMVSLIPKLESSLSVHLCLTWNERRCWTLFDERLPKPRTDLTRTVLIVRPKLNDVGSWIWKQWIVLSESMYVVFSHSTSYYNFFWFCSSERGYGRRTTVCAYIHFECFMTIGMIFSAFERHKYTIQRDHKDIWDKHKLLLDEWRSLTALHDSQHRFCLSIRCDKSKRDQWVKEYFKNSQLQCVTKAGSWTSEHVCCFVTHFIGL